MKQKKKTDIASEISIIEKSTSLLDEQIELGLIVIDQMKGVVIIDNSLYLYFEKIKDGVTSLFQMIRWWINLQRGHKKGDLMRIVEVAEQSKNIPEGMSIENIKKSIEKDYSIFTDEEPVMLSVIGTSQKPITDIIQTKNRGEIQYHPVEEKP